MEILWTKSTLVGLLLAESKLPLLPAEPWPLEVGIETLVEAARPQSEVHTAASGWLRRRPSPSGRVEGVRAWLREAHQAGLITPVGSGWTAGYRPEAGWLARSAALHGELDFADAEAVSKASQRLVAMSTMLWKKAAA